MEANEMRELLSGYLGEMNWAGGATKEAVLAHIADRDDALRVMVGEYVAEGTYASPEELITVIPHQAWQDVQGDAWRGAENRFAEDVPSGFRDSAAGRSRNGD